MSVFNVLAQLAKIEDYIITDGPGPKLVKQSLVINIQKGGTLFFCLFLMVYFGNYSAEAMVYTGLHGSYGFMWLLKHFTFPDVHFDQPLSLAGLLLLVAVLGAYWSFPYILISSQNVSPAPTWLLMSTIILHTAGVVIMMLADAQKHFTLKIQRGLITYGMFRYIRHPNYTGEMMLYGSYVLLVRHWFPVLVVAAIWSSVFAARIVAKEISMSRYKEWPAYKSQSFYVIPYVL